MQLCAVLFYILCANVGSLHGRTLELLQTVHVHVLLEQGNHVGVEGLPVGVVEVVLLRGFLLVALDDGEVLLVEHRLHDEPGDGLLVVGVDVGSLDKLSLELGDGLLIGLSAEVCGKSKVSAEWTIGGI